MAKYKYLIKGEEVSTGKFIGCFCVAKNIESAIRLAKEYGIKPHVVPARTKVLDFEEERVTDVNYLQGVK